MADWSRPFEDPIILPDGRTLRDAADYITSLPKAEQNLEPWQTAVEALIKAAEDRGPVMHSRIGMLRALNRHIERVFQPIRASELHQCADATDAAADG